MRSYGEITNTTLLIYGMLDNIDDPREVVAIFGSALHIYEERHGLTKDAMDALLDGMRKTRDRVHAKRAAMEAKVDELNGEVTS